MATFTDSFSGTSGDRLGDRSGWTKFGSGYFTCDPQINASGQLKLASDTSDVALYGQTPSSLDHYVQANVFAGFGFPGTGGRPKLCVRSLDRNDTWSASYNSDDGRWGLYRNNTRNASIAYAAPSGELVRLEAEGNVIRLKVAGTTILTADGTDGSTNSRVGIHGEGVAGSDPVLDNWESGELGGGDVTAPTLTSATATATSATTATGGVTTTEAGPAWAVLTTSSTTPSAAQIKAGQNHTGAAASASATATLAVGANPGVFAFTGLTGGGTYWEHVVQDDTATPANTSTPITSASSITTPTPDTTNPTWPGGTTLGATAKTDTTVTLTASADATDNVGVTGYEWSSDDGASYPFTSLTKTFQFTALSALNSYQFKSRAYDAAGNKSAAISLTTSTYRAGDTAANILANTGPVGGNPAGFLYAFASTVSGTDWISYTITSGPTPSGGTLTANPDGTFTYFGPDAATMVIQPEVNGVNAAETITVTLYDQSPDTELPVLTGSITVTSLTSTGYNLSWPTGTDNIGVTAYEYSLNGGSSWTSQAGTSVSITGRTPESTDQVRVRAKDAAGNVSTPALSTSVTLLAAPDVTAPLLFNPTGDKLGAYGAVGSVSTNEANGTLYSLISTDNTLIDVDDDPFWIAVGKQTQSVTAIGTQNVTFGGLAPLTTYTIYFGHEDAAGNRSNVARSLSLTTDAAGAVVTSKFNDGKAMRSCMWHPMKKAINA